MRPLSRNQGQSIQLGANDPRARRANAADLASSARALEALQRLEELPPGASTEQIVQRLNQLMKLVRGEVS